MCSFSACETALKPDTPGNAALLMVKAISDGDYARLKEYFCEGREGKVSEGTFQDSRKLITTGASYANYELVTFENGEMLLIMLTPYQINGKYEIQMSLLFRKK
ncbi:MAG: hypothetical protein BWY11_01989 [Firmicutes bacterium ADurb.Bin182]|nr:MAG: hypothetical protein BWY11_01989 [Firmicutes bacterium ADurb.Bin182]